MNHPNCLCGKTYSEHSRTNLGLLCDFVGGDFHSVYRANPNDSTKRVAVDHETTPTPFGNKGHQIMPDGVCENPDCVHNHPGFNVGDEIPTEQPLGSIMCMDCHKLASECVCQIAPAPSPESKEGEIDILVGKSDYEIRHAAAFWFEAQACYNNGEQIPSGIFMLSAKQPSQKDIEWAQKVIEKRKLEQTTSELREKRELKPEADRSFCDTDIDPTACKPTGKRFKSVDELAKHYDIKLDQNKLDELERRGRVLREGDWTHGLSRPEAAKGGAGYKEIADDFLSENLELQNQVQTLREELKDWQNGANAEAHAHDEARKLIGELRKELQATKLRALSAEGLVEMLQKKASEGKQDMPYVSFQEPIVAEALQARLTASDQRVKVLEEGISHALRNIFGVDPSFPPHLDYDAAVKILQETLRLHPQTERSGEK